MPTKKTRINISIPKNLNQLLTTLAKRDDVPVATKALELIKTALEIEEDAMLSKVANQRINSVKKWYSEDAV